MTRLLLLAALLAAPLAHAQTSDGDPALAETAALLRDDFDHLTRMTATAALLHEADGVFPATAFDLLGSRSAERTGLRTTPLSALDLEQLGETLRLVYVPLPQDPYVPEDHVITLTVVPDGAGRYRGEYEVVRRENPDRGGAAIPYDVAGQYRVERAFGTLCVETALVEPMLAAGAFVPDPAALSTTPLTLRVHPPGEDEPVFYETTTR
ncbi:hypothetical protein [Rubrivirga litoralis]|uniref:Uncharacterized protein n=1 Tax=Rubrivirga litoralis TaxID=3075598 RepID=A0ABU3BST3_9BACT|nr:hypothetical protein [Rubrivirga sp. F394]MDT0632347.1 hypothetical protein [Rubrivirga sp. F394]